MAVIWSEVTVPPIPCGWSPHSLFVDFPGAMPKALIDITWDFLPEALGQSLVSPRSLDCFCILSFWQRIINLNAFAGWTWQNGSEGVYSYTARKEPARQTRRRISRKQRRQFDKWNKCSRGLQRWAVEGVSKQSAVYIHMYNSTKTQVQLQCLNKQRNPAKVECKKS